MKSKQEELELFYERYNANIKNEGTSIPDISTEDLNNIWEEGAYQGHNLINAPSNEYLRIVVIKHSEDWYVQQALNPSQVMWLRARRGDDKNIIVSDWKEVDFGDGSEQGKVEVTIVEKPSNHPLASKDGHGYMSKNDWTKLHGIEEEANKYIHPETHSADIIIQDEFNRFVTDEEKTSWNNKSDSNHNHDESYSPINHKHKQMEETIKELTDQNAILLEEVGILKERIDSLELNSNTETIAALINKVSDIEAILNDHMDGIE